jgi:hypothetical protein
MTKPQLQTMLDEQDKKCRLCNRPITLNKYDGVVDHDHFDGRVRGILCHECNAMIGYIENTIDDPIFIVDYLSS